VQNRLVDVVAAEVAHRPLAIREVLVLVPTAAAGHLLQMTLEQALLDKRTATVLPGISTVSALRQSLAERSLGRVRLVDPLLREALLDQALQEAATTGSPPPFTLRGSLSARILAFSDQVWLSGHLLEDFVERAAREFDVPGDVGAERMAGQTRFLKDGLQLYQDKLRSLELTDMATVYSTLLDDGTRFPYRKIFVAGGDTVRPRDLAFLVSLPGVESIEYLIPDGIAETYPVRTARDLAATHHRSPGSAPTLLKPAEREEVAFVARDREEVLVGVARLLKARAAAGRLPPLERIAVVVPTPLPYLYLAKKALGQAGIPYQLQDDFPLATEPYLAAVDLVLDSVDLEGRRGAALGMLRSPFFRFADVGPAAVAALDRELARTREPGGSHVWRRMLEDGRRQARQPALPGMEDRERTEPLLPALEALVATGNRVGPIGDPQTSLTVKTDLLRGFIQDFGRPLPAVGDAERHERARGALLSILDRLSAAARQVGAPPRDRVPHFLGSNRTERHPNRRCSVRRPRLFRDGGTGRTERG
jgi:hypothetical protein